MQDEFQDPAEYREASYYDHPSNSIDRVESLEFLKNCILDCIPPWQPKVRAEVSEAINKGWNSAIGSGWLPDTSKHDCAESLATLLDLLTAQKANIALRAWAIRIAINRCPYSEVDVAKMLGVTKAAVSKVKIEMQECLGLTPRCGRSEEARETFSKLCKKRGKKIRQSSWTGASIFQKALASG